MFSGVFHRPAYQTNVVADYLKQANLPASTLAMFNSTGRACTDNYTHCTTPQSPLPTQHNTDAIHIVNPATPHLLVADNDAAAFGNNIVVVDGGAVAASGGTSASGPIFAGVVGLLNDARLAAGKPPVGFLNPLL